MKEETLAGKKLYLEIVRIIAILLVIFNHTNKRGFMYFLRFSSGSILYYLGMALSSLCGCAVPFFFMISGTLLLGKKESISEIVQKRILRILLILILFSAFYYLQGMDWNNIRGSIRDYLLLIYSSQVIVPFWFLYLYLSFLLGLPFLRAMAKGTSEKGFIYLAVIASLFQGIIPIVQYRLSEGSVTLNGNLNISYLTAYMVVYPLIGFYLSHRPPLKKKMLVIGGILFIFSLVIICKITDYRIALTGETDGRQVEAFFGAFRVIQAGWIFALVRALTERYSIQNFFQRAIFSMGRCVFGIYLLEQFLRENLVFIYDNLCKYLPNYISVMVYVVCVFLMGWWLTLFLKLLPGFRKLL